MATNDCCDCNKKPKLIFACSGAADVGELADKVARQLTCDGFGKMACLAGIGGQISGIVLSAEAAEEILAIDGCPLNCASQTLKNAGFTDFKHLTLTDLGFAKGKTPITPENLKQAVAATAKQLNGGEC